MRPERQHSDRWQFESRHQIWSPVPALPSVTQCNPSPQLPAILPVWEEPVPQEQILEGGRGRACFKQISPHHFGG